MLRFSFLFCIAMPFWAASISTKSNVTGSGTVCVSFNVECINFGMFATSTGTDIATPHAFEDYGSGRTVEVTGVSVKADYGYLRMRGDSRFAILPYALHGSVNIGVTGTAAFTDMLTIYGGTGTGYLASSIPPCFQCTFTRNVPQSFEYGVPFAIGMSIYAWDSTPGGNYALLAVDYRLEMAVTPAPNGALHQGIPVTYESESGHAYAFTNGSQVPIVSPDFADTFQVPEPGTLYVVALGIAMLLYRATIGRTAPPAA